jgi:hypothetical protein
MITFTVYDYECNRSFVIDDLVIVACLASGEAFWIIPGGTLADNRILFTFFTFILFPVSFIMAVIVVCCQESAKGTHQNSSMMTSRRCLTSSGSQLTVLRHEASRPLVHMTLHGIKTGFGFRSSQSLKLHL